MLSKQKERSGFAIVFDSDMELDVVDKLPHISAPTLVIVGANDLFYGADLTRVVFSGFIIVQSRPNFGRRNLYLSSARARCSQKYLTDQIFCK